MNERIYRKIDRIGNLDIIMCFESKKGVDNYFKLIHCISVEVKKAIRELRKQGIEGNEYPIKKIIYDRWGQSAFDGHGYPIRKCDRI